MRINVLFPHFLADRNLYIDIHENRTAHCDEGPLPMCNIEIPQTNKLSTSCYLESTEESLYINYSFNFMCVGFTTVPSPETSDDFVLVPSDLPTDRAFNDFNSSPPRPSTLPIQIPKCPSSPLKVRLVS